MNELNKTHIHMHTHTNIRFGHKVNENIIFVLDFYILIICMPYVLFTLYVFKQTI